MAEDEFRDENRQRLIARLDSILSRSEQGFVLAHGMWAAFWLCDITRLSEIVMIAEVHPSLLRVFLNSDEKCLKALYDSISPHLAATGANRMWARESTKLYGVNFIDYGVGRRQGTGRYRFCPNNIFIILTQIFQCLTRDNKGCVLTRPGEPLEVAHIYPYSMNTVPQDGDFWISLDTFFINERISRWKSAVFTEQSTEVVPNLMALSPSAHAYWGKALFALKPQNESQDGMRMDVQFFWLRPYYHRSSMLLTTTPSLPSGLMSSVNNVKLYDRHSNMLRGHHYIVHG